MKDLVEAQKTEVWAESNLIARKIGIKHNRFMKTVNIVIDRIDNLRGNVPSPKYRFEMRKYRGREFEVCLMSREFFSLVMMRFETRKAFEWQVKFNAAFYDIESRLLQERKNLESEEWLTLRSQSKAVRRDETDIIQEFVEYAKASGSKNCNMYYKHFTNATYGALKLIQNKKPRLRETLDMFELHHLVTAERLARKRIKHYMAQGEHYKVIYELVKQDLLAYSEMVLIDAKERA